MGVRKYVPNCAHFTHPHVHSVIGGIEVCEEERFAKTIKAQAEVEARRSLVQRLTPAGGPRGEVTPENVNVGHYGILVVLALVSVGIYVSGWVLSLVSIGTSTEGVLSAAVYAAVGIASALVVDADLRDINKVLGSNVISGIWWPLLSFFFPYIVGPLYTFDRRRSALVWHR